MYIESIEINDFRTFRQASIDLAHKDRRWSDELPKPRLPNVNLLLGNNGCGKTTLLKAIALAAMGPAVGDSGIYPYRLIRREPVHGDAEPESAETATIAARLRPHPQDDAPVDYVESHVTISRRGDIERLRWTHPQDKLWHPIFSSDSDAFFMVGYGATRRVEKRDLSDIASRSQSSFVRAQRIQSLFEESYSLLPLSAWLPGFRKENPGRYKQIVHLLDKLMGAHQFRFAGRLEDNEYVFEKHDLSVPFPALSDGYRAFLGWIGDLLYHVCMTCPSGKKLVDNHGLVMVDEIDLHIHPKWQINVLPRLAKALPNIQFIVTSHSPLIVGSLEWMNIIVMEADSRQAFKPRRRREAVHGMDADQVLISDYFGMSTTRSRVKVSRIDELTTRARTGDLSAAKELIRELKGGSEKQ